MKINCFRISEGPRLTLCDYSFATEAINQKKARVWIDILDANRGELEMKLDELSVEVNGVRRHNVLGNQPTDDMLLRAGDVLMLLGQPVTLEAAEKRLRQGHGG